MAKVKVTRQFLNGREVVSEGTLLVVSDRRAKELERNNLVVPAEVGAGTAAQRRAARRTGDADPTVQATTGGPTGEAQPRSSSRRGRPPGRRRSSAGEA